MNYFEAKRIYNLMVQFRPLSLEYWGKKPKDDRTWYDKDLRIAPESDESVLLREEINKLIPVVDTAAIEMGINTIMQSYPAPVVGGPVLDVHLFLSVITQDLGHGGISQQEVLDHLNRCVGLAEDEKRNAFWRLVLPWYWLIDIPATVVRLPFAIMLKVGLPPSIEKTVIAQTFKVILIIALIAYASYKGIQIASFDLMKLLK